MQLTYMLTVFIAVATAAPSDPAATITQREARVVGM
jgi:hypothetical protein